MRFLGWLLRPIPPGSGSLWVWLVFGAVATTLAVVLIVQGNVWLGAAILAAWLGYRVPAELLARRRR